MFCVIEQNWTLHASGLLETRNTREELFLLTVAVAVNVGHGGNEKVGRLGAGAPRLLAATATVMATVVGTKRIASDSSLTRLANTSKGLCLSFLYTRSRQNLGLGNQIGAKRRRQLNDWSGTQRSSSALIAPFGVL